MLAFPGYQRSPVGVSFRRRLKWSSATASLGAIVAIAAQMVLCDLCVGQPPSSDPANTSEADEESATHLAEMRERASEFKASTGSEERKELILSSKPVLRFSDPTRTASDGTIWVWCDNDIPIAIVTVERYPTFWSYELVSMCADRVVVARPDGLQWRPSDPGIQLEPMPDAEVPADNKSARLRQMRDMARRFALSESYRENTYELRLLPNPVQRFSNVDKGVVDGALFIYSHGTNPEAILMVEGRRPGEGAAVWSFGFVRLTAAEVTAKIGARTVWSERLQLQTAHDAPYTHFRLSRVSD